MTPSTSSRESQHASAHQDGKSEGAVPSGHSPVGEGPSLRQLLRNVSPALWQRAAAERRTRREQSGRMLDLLVWILEKNGATVARQVKQEYFDQGRTIEGRLDLVAVRGDERVAVEMSFRPSHAAAFKLLSARRAGAATVMLAGFAPTAHAARQAMDRHMARSTENWFTLVSL